MPAQPPPAAKATPSLPPQQLKAPPPPVIGRGPEARTVSAIVHPQGKAGPGKFAWIAGVVLVLGVALFAIMLLMPKPGSIVVAVTGPGNKALDAVQVFVDGKKQCDTSPCVVNGVKTGPHYVKVSAAGYSPSAQAVKVSSGDELVLNLQLGAGGEGTGIKVTAEGSGLKLWVDDKEIGPLPQEVKDLTPGDHKIRVAGNDRFAPYEETVSVAAEQIKSIGPLELKVVRGLAMIEPGENADGAKVLLVNGAEKRQIPKLPYRVEISTDKGYQLVASKKGFPTATIPVTFEPGKDQKRFVIDLRSESGEAVEEPSKASGAGAVAHAGSSRGRTAAPAVPAPAAPAAPAPAKPAAPAAAAGQGTLNINSIPQSNVLLDGRPLGKTPRAGVSTAAGSHRVTFIHPEHGRKEITVNVAAGKTATAAVRFP